MKDLWVCCDIEGTYDHFKTKKIIHFLQLLSEYGDVSCFNRVIFSFVSSLSAKEVDFYCKTHLVPYLNLLNINNIFLGPQIGYDGYSNFQTKTIVKETFPSSSKAMQMKEVLFHKKEYFGNTDVSSLIYIDDNPNINPVLLIRHLSFIKTRLIDEMTFASNKEIYDIDCDPDNFSVRVYQDLDNPDFAMDTISRMVEEEKKKSCKKILA